MSYSITVPNAGQSPGVFPSQNNTNFNRLQAIVNSEHNFTNASATSQGIHKQVTLINYPSVPMSLPLGGNGTFYSMADTSGNSQLNWYNGVSNQQVTGVGNTLLSSGTVTLTQSLGVPVYVPVAAVPANSFGILYVWMVGVNNAWQQLMWQSSNTTVLTYNYLGFVGSSQSNPLQPVQGTNGGSGSLLTINLKAVTNSYLGTYQYRLYQVN